jgi:hypothetical protein
MLTATRTADRKNILNFNRLQDIKTGIQYVCLQMGFFELTEGKISSLNKKIFP